MPTYEYECKKCGNVFDVFQSFSDKPVTVCTKCGGEVRRLINGGAGVIYKGAGFYSTDNSSSGKKTGETKTKEAAASGGEKPAPCASCPHSDGGCPEKAAG
ncbi:MAG: zinc ribbon domain-containing protein [Spirochaetaceae bacterium]|jgi:putative FmdB family regulatory protein|nr:zinc ribbon domain-containing protein [Spirochaetaceae bacterium]